MSSNRRNDPERYGISLPWRHCPHCHKRGYDSRKIAKRAAREHHGEHLTVYRCDSELFHIGRIAQGVKYGQISRHELYGSRTA